VTCFATLFLRKSARFHDKKTLDLQKTLDYRYVTDLSDYKKIGVVFKNRRVFDEPSIFIYLFQTRWSTEHTHTRVQRIILLRLKIF